MLQTVFGTCQLKHVWNCTGEPGCAAPWVDTVFYQNPDIEIGPGIQPNSWMAWKRNSPCCFEALSYIPVSCINSFVDSFGVTDTVVIDPLSPEGIESSSGALLSSPIFWEIFSIGFGATLLLSVPKWGAQAASRAMRIFDR